MGWALKDGAGRPPAKHQLCVGSVPNAVCMDVRVAP